MITKAPPTTIVLNRIMVMAISFFIVLGLSPAWPAASDERNQSEPIELIYDYLYPDSFMTAYLEEYLLYHHNLSVSIRFNQRPHPQWFTFSSDEHLQLAIAKGECPADVLSLTAAPLWAHEELFLAEISKSQLQTHANTYYERILIEQNGKELYRTQDGNWYALTGYLFQREKSVFHLAATQSATERLNAIEREVISTSSIEFTHYYPVDFDTIDNDLRTVSNHANKPPMLAWNDFEFSFSPFYSAFGISTIGRNLMGLTNAATTGISYYQQPSGNVLPALISEPFREFIRTLSSWRAEGVIDSDFLSVDYSAAIARATDRAQRGDPYSYVSIPFTSAIQPSRMFAAFAQAQPVGLFQIEKSDYVMKESIGSSPFYGTEAYCGSFTDEQIRAILLIFEHTRMFRLDQDGNLDEEGGWMKRVYGIRDKHYHLPNGVLEPFLRQPPDNHNKFQMWHFKAHPHIWLQTNEEQIRPYLTPEIFWPTYDHMLAGEPFHPPRGSRNLQAEGTIERLNGVIEEFVYPWIEGTRDIDSSWDDYVQRLKQDAGPLTEELN